MKKKCKLCGEKTNVRFNINFKETPICDSCAISITVQQVHWWSDVFREKEFSKWADKELKKSDKKRKKKNE